MASVSRKRRWANAAIFILGCALVVFAARGIYLGYRSEAAAQAEYASLRELTHCTVTKAKAASLRHSSTPDDPKISEPSPSEEPDQTGAGPVYVSPFFGALAEINSDFAGWIVIPGTAIDYPVVQGTDNVKYLKTTFSGVQNPAGAIFLDCRIDDGFNAPVSLIYGHNMRDGSMFSPLTDYLKQNFLEAHPEIIIFTANGETLIYRIAEVRRTDAWDDVYSLDFNDIPDADRLLILSTCLDNADRSSRLLVFAVLEGL